jgi:hypothetical protein
MVWVRHSDTFTEEFEAHEELTLEAGWLHIAALCYCNRLLTDGHIPRRKVPTLSQLIEDPDLAVKSLIAAGYWEQTETGYLIVNYLTDQRPKDKVLRDREAGRIRQQNWMDKRRGHVKPAEETPTKGNRSPTKKAPAKKATTPKKRTNAVSDGVTNAYPAPPRPERRGRGRGR